MRYSRLLLLALPLVLAACGSDAGNHGTPRLGLVNADQSAVASTDLHQYEPLRGRVVRTAGGNLVMDWLVTPAYAADTTVLQGSPVAGAVVCMDPPVDGGPKPTQLCNNTGSDGTVQFFYGDGTRAGTYVYHANATVDGAPIQPDSAHFVVVTGPAAQGFPFAHQRGAGDNTLVMDSAHVGGFAPLADRYGNPVPWRFEGNRFATPADTTLGTVGAHTLVADSVGTDSVHIVTADSVVAAGQLRVYAGPHPYESHLLMDLQF